jgi:hypothetical protein
MNLSVDPSFLSRTVRSVATRSASDDSASAFSPCCYVLVILASFPASRALRWAAVNALALLIRRSGPCSLTALLNSLHAARFFYSTLSCSSSLLSMILTSAMASSLLLLSLLPPLLLLPLSLLLDILRALFFLAGILLTGDSSSLG